MKLLRLLKAVLNPSEDVEATWGQFVLLILVMLALTLVGYIFGCTVAIIVELVDLYLAIHAVVQ